MPDNSMELEYGAEILTLVDDEGEEHEFELVDSEELEGTRYVALVPVFDDAQEQLDDSGELIVLRIVEENDEEFLEAIEEEEEFDRISEFFMERLSDEFYFEEEDGEED